MSDGMGSSVPGRQLGRALRELRTRAGMSLDGAARTLRRSVRTVGRMERGLGTVRAHEVRAMCELYGAEPEVTAQLVGLAAEVGAKGWWCSYGGTLPDPLELYANLESVARRLREYQPMLVPALLQTRRYASALLAGHPNMPEREQEQQVEARLRRQALLVRTLPEPPRFEAVLSEPVLLATGYGQAIMAEQLRHLAAVSELPHVSIRVVPLAAGMHLGAIAGAFVRLDFPPRSWTDVEPPVVYRESLTGALYLDREEELAAYERAWASLNALALDEEQSHHLITEINEVHHSAELPS